CEIFATDLIANYQGQPERDYASVCALLRTALRETDATYRYSLRIGEILVSGDTAVVRLAWTLAVDKPGSPEQVIEEPAIDIFRRHPDGTWKITRYLAYPEAR